MTVHINLAAHLQPKEQDMYEGQTNRPRNVFADAAESDDKPMNAMASRDSVSNTERSYQQLEEELTSLEGQVHELFDKLHMALRPSEEKRGIDATPVDPIAKAPMARHLDQLSHRVRTLCYEVVDVIDRVDI